MSEIMIYGRLQFMRKSIWVPTSGMKDSPGKAKDADSSGLKYRCRLIFSRDSDAFGIADEALRKAAEAGWGANWKAVVKAMEGSKKFLRNGNNQLNEDGEVYAEMKDMFFVSAANEARPTIWDLDGRTPLVQDDGRPYSGCYAGLIVDVWPNVKFKGISATLKGIQFKGEGEAFSGSAPVAAGVFPDLSGSVASKPLPADAAGDESDLY